MTLVSDKNILELFCRDRRGGIRVLFDRYYRPMVLFAGTLIRDDVMAEDVVQEIFVRLWKEDYLTKVGEKALSSYLFSAVRNSCYTHANKRDILKSTVDYSGVEIASELIPSVNQQVVDRVMVVINRLPEQTRNVVERVLMHDMEYRHVAEELNISVNTVKTLLRNGMRVLRESFRENDLLLFLMMVYK